MLKNYQQGHFINYHSEVMEESANSTTPKQQSIIVHNLEGNRYGCRKNSFTIAHLYLSSPSLARQKKPPPELQKDCEDTQKETAPERHKPGTI